MPIYFADIFTVQMSSVHCIFVSVAYIIAHIAKSEYLVPLYYSFF